MALLVRRQHAGSRFLDLRETIGNRWLLAARTVSLCKVTAPFGPGAATGAANWVTELRAIAWRRCRLVPAPTGLKSGQRGFRMSACSRMAAFGSGARLLAKEEETQTNST